ncbi:protein CobW [Pycnococcus provasolii]
MSRKARAKQHLAASASASASASSSVSAPADEYDSSCGFGVRYFACSLGYCPVKDTCASCSTALLLLAPSGSEGLGSANVWNVEAFKTLRAVASALASLAAAAAEGQSDVPTDICIVDAAPLAAPKDMAAELEAEAGATVLGKRLGKPVARAVEKLSISGAAMIAAGAACTLLLKLMRGDQARTPNASRLVLLHPQVSKVCERLMLTPDWRKAYGRNAPANVPVDVVFQDEASRSHLEPLLRGAYPDGRTAVCGDGEAAVLLARAFAAAVSDEPDALDGAHITSSPPAWDPDTYDLLGRSVWLASLSIEMDRTTKQYTPMAEDVTIDVFNSGVMEEEAAEAAAAAAAATVAATKPNAPPAPEPPAPSKAATNSRDDEAIRPATTEHPASSSAKHCVGGLVLRGNRCVLVRSLSKAPLWQGMVLPAMPFALGTDPVERARESVSTFCDVDGDSELVPLSPNVPPVALYHAPGCRTDVYFFYAKHPPPPGPLEDADMEDDEDYYDWYTFPNAIAAVQRGKEAYASAAAACLEAAAMALRNAHVAGILEHKYGGIFGQEFLTGGIRSQPQKKLEVPVATKPTVAKLPAAKTPAAKTLAKTKKLRTVPVTLLSGFLGAGKTTLLKRILEQTHAQDTVRVAVLVNDMAAVNIDANLVRNTKMLQREEKLVELHNGCICCTLREDLVKALADLVAEDRFDAIVVESTGVSDPIEVAETFTMEMEDGGANPSAEWLVDIKPIVEALRGKGSLNELAKLDTCVTLVDVAGFDTDMGTSADLTERFRGSADEGDERSVAPLLMSQIEFADVIVLSKCDLVTEEKAVAVERAVRALNAEARVIRAKHGDVALSEVLRTGLFDMRKTSRAAGWLKTMLMESSGEKAAHVSETEEYGISSFVYKARTPFHPVRLMSFLEDHFVVKHEDSSAAQEKGGEKEADLAKRESDAKTKSARMRKRFGNILRSKGFMWLAGRDDQIGEWSQAGAVGQFGCGGPWMSCQPEEAWPAKDSEEYAMIMKDYAGAVLKDRRQEVVIIGQNLDQSAIEHALDACLVTAKECGLVEEASSSSSKEDAWKLGLKLDMARDPFPPWPEYDPSAEHDHHDQSTTTMTNSTTRSRTFRKVIPNCCHQYHFRWVHGLRSPPPPRLPKRRHHFSRVHGLLSRLPRLQKYRQRRPKRCARFR